LGGKIKLEIELNLDEYKKNGYLTHNFHPYPAKFIPQIPRELILKLSKENEWVIDPFCGSGTSLVEAKLLNRNAIGVDINPLACIMSQVKTTLLSPKDVETILQHVLKIENEVLCGKVYDVPEFYNINHWFKEDVQRDLATIRHHIFGVEDEKIRRFLSVAFASIVVKLSNQESDTRYAAIEKTIKPKEAAKLFKSKTFDMINRIREFKKIASGSNVIVYNKSSTSLDYISQQVALSVTSPPYMNSYDYYLYHKHRMCWLGIDYREAQDKEFGSRNKHNDKGEGIESYNGPIRENVSAMRSVLRPGGYYCMVVGDAILRGQLIKMNTNFDSIMLSEGYKKIDEITFNQRKYTRSFTPKLKNQYKDSYILIYRNQQ
jgi:DNA modification methylase